MAQEEAGDKKEKMGEATTRDYTRGNFDPLRRGNRKRGEEGVNQRSDMGGEGYWFE